MIVHVMPTYACNMRCEYCYLKGLERHTDILSIKKAEEVLTAISSHYDIERINIYGGEIGLLSDGYLKELFTACHAFTHHITAVTNLSRPEILSLDPMVSWTTSVNDERQENQKVIANLLMIENRLNLSQVVTPSVLKKGADRCLRELSMLGNSVEFLRYSPAISNAIWDISNRKYEDFMIDVLDHAGNYPIQVQNMNDLRACIKGTYNAYMDSNLFISPNGSLNYVSYENGLEYFHPVQTIEQFMVITHKEKHLYENKCRGCPYLGHCYAEHLHDSKAGDVCCGLPNLLRYYEENIYQDN